MTANNNVFALLDSITGQIYAHVVDAENPPSLLSPNNAYWNKAITTQSGNPLVAVNIPIVVYNDSTIDQLSIFLLNSFNGANIIALNNIVAP